MKKQPWMDKYQFPLEGDQLDKFMKELQERHPIEALPTRRWYIQSKTGAGYTILARTRGEASVLFHVMPVFANLQLDFRTLRGSKD